MFLLLGLLLIAPEIRIELRDGAIIVQGATSATVRVVSGSAAEIAERPAVLGTWKPREGGSIFEPRFPLTPGLTYRVEVSSTVQRDLTIPKVERKPTTIVEQVYPSSDVLLENHLRFYLHFSAPMRPGEVYRHIRLVDERGKTVETPWLELDEELWDADHRRFTLLIHPGRIKQGLRPREDLGPVLEVGKRYTLIIDRTWQDAEGTPLRSEYRKSFRVEAGTDQRIDPKRWQIQPAPAGSREALVMQFDRSLDHALLHHMVQVVDADGKPLRGTIAVGKNEREWRFTPLQPWRAGKHEIIINTALEDYAGNRIDRPFEVDVVRPTERSIKQEWVHLPLVVK